MPTAVDYDRWLEAPYQDRAGSGDSEESWLEELTEANWRVTCECGSSTTLGTVALEVTELFTWVSCGYFEWSGTYQWQCVHCGEWTAGSGGGDNFD